MGWCQSSRPHNNDFTYVVLNQDAVTPESTITRHSWICCVKSSSTERNERPSAGGVIDLELLRKFSIHLARALVVLFPFVILSLEEICAR